MQNSANQKLGEEQKLDDKNPFIAGIFPPVCDCRQRRRSDFFCSDSRNKPHLGRSRREREKERIKKKENAPQCRFNAAKCSSGAPPSVCSANSRGPK